MTGPRLQVFGSLAKSSSEQGKHNNVHQEKKVLQKSLEESLLFDPKFNLLVQKGM